MNLKRIESKIYGSILGAALGDAVGGPFEFLTAEQAREIAGSLWIDRLYPYKAATGPHGVWQVPSLNSELPPAGTGTDDTRYNWLFLQLAIEKGKIPDASEFAKKYIKVFNHPDSVFKGHRELVKKQFEHWEGVCHGYLNKPSKLFPDLSGDTLLARSLGLNFPVLSGLITLTSAGLLFPGKPEKAYKSAFHLAFFDIGYAKEAVAILAASISIAISQDINPENLFKEIILLDPFHLGGEFSGPFIISSLKKYYNALAKSKTDKETAQTLSSTLRHFHVFDPFKTLAIAFFSIIAANADPIRSILIAVNHINKDKYENSMRYQDVDCYACITGAIAGAIVGIEAFPKKMIDQVVKSNKLVYGIDLKSTIKEFIKKVYARNC